MTVPIYALNQVNDERCEWLVPGMLRDKVLALVKTLHQRPRSRLVPLPGYAEEFVAESEFAQGALMDVLLRHVRERTQLAVQRNDFKLEQLQPHLLMNFRIVDEHGRQLGTGRNLAALKAELGGAGAFGVPGARRLEGRDAGSPAPSPASAKAAGDGGAREPRAARRGSAGADAPRYTAWTFGELPELMEVRRGAQVLIGFPALIDKTAHVEIEVFDEPGVAAAKHRAGLRRLVSLQIRDALKYLEKNIPDLTKMSVAYMPLGSAEELRTQIVDLAIERAFLAEPLPTDAAMFERRLADGRGRLTLIANEIARSAGAVLVEHAAAVRKLKDARAPKETADDVTAQLARLVPKRFLVQTHWAALAHLPRYLKGVVMRLDKLRADPARDAQRLAELRPLEQRWLRMLTERKGVADARLEEFRWLLEELRVSLFAQELRTPQPVSVKRLEKAWDQLLR